MEKVITLRFPGTCKKCGAPIPSGERAVWLGNKAGVRHENCTPQGGTEIEKPKEQPDNIDTFTIDYSELRESFGKFVVDPNTVYTNDARAGRELRECWNYADWTGCSIAEMQEWLKNGYKVEGLQGVTSLVPAKPRRKVRYSEEGDELLLDLAWSGSDEPFMEWEKRASKPGLTVECWIDFNAGFPAKTIIAYQSWIARALQTLDENGVDMEVVIVSKLMNLYGGWNTVTKTQIRVRKAGEAADFANWSAMFSPGGFRMLNIMGTGIHANRKGEKINHGYGSPLDYGAWTVAYDEERNIVVIGNSGHERVFPELEMTDKLIAVLAKLSG